MTRGLVLFGHGSRDPAWRQPMDAVAQAIRRKRPDVAVACAFLELQEPTLAAAVRELADSGARAVHVFPMFLGLGRHAREDLPALLDAVRASHPGLELTVSPSAGELPEMIELLAELALARQP